MKLPVSRDLDRFRNPRLSRRLFNFSNAVCPFRLLVSPLLDRSLGYKCLLVSYLMKYYTLTFRKVSLISNTTLCSFNVDTGSLKFTGNFVPASRITILTHYEYRIIRCKCTSCMGVSGK